MLKVRCTRRMALWTVLALGSATGFVACEDDDGPAEEMGEAVDDAVEDAADEVEDATDN